MWVAASSALAQRRGQRHVWVWTVALLHRYAYPECMAQGRLEGWWAALCVPFQRPRPVAPTPRRAPATVAPRAAEVALPPDWYPDPHKQAGYRFWDGSRWTERVEA